MPRQQVAADPSRFDGLKTQSQAWEPGQPATGPRALLLLADLDVRLGRRLRLVVILLPLLVLHRLLAEHAGHLPVVRAAAAAAAADVVHAEVPRLLRELA